MLHMHRQMADEGVQDPDTLFAVSSWSQKQTVWHFHTHNVQSIPLL